MSFNEAASAYGQAIQTGSITQAMIDSGLVLGYIKYRNSPRTTQVESTGTYMEQVLLLKISNDIPMGMILRVCLSGILRSGWQ